MDTIHSVASALLVRMATHSDNDEKTRQFRLNVLLKHNVITPFQFEALGGFHNAD